MASSLLRVVPKILPKLDADFRPPYLGHKNFLSSAKKSGKAVPLQFALERSSGVVSRYDTLCFAEGSPGSADNAFYADRILKMLLWARGGFRVYVNGPKSVVSSLQKAYAKGGSRAFDADFFAKVYEAKKFEILASDAKKLPASNEKSRPIGRHLEGCRIGFDAGGSDRKVAAVIDGKQVFVTETVWEPKINADPQYHFDGIDDSIRQAAEHLPRIDAIGVSSAGIYVDNRAMVASLFRKVPEELFNKKIKNIYLDIAKKWGDVPIEVANDGDVTALAGSMSLNDNAVLGIAMGTSQAVGYVDGLGHVTGWLNELAFAPVDYAENAPLDSEWSGDRGTGVNYFSQDAVIRLAPKLGIHLDASSAPGTRLKAVQTMFKQGDSRVAAIFETIGVYLGYAILAYAEFYELKHVLILGRVTSHEGGNIVLAKCKEVMAAEDPVLSRKISVNLPDEASRRVGQAIAAASLPEIKKTILRPTTPGRGGLHARPTRPAKKKAPKKSRAKKKAARPKKKKR
jgi:predicted NBD/HSP70 family sugar kinase